MPFVNVRTARGILDGDGKRELHERLTDLMVEIAGRGKPEFRSLVFVLIDEENPANWSVGGTQVTDAQVRTLRAGSTG